MKKPLENLSKEEISDFNHDMEFIYKTIAEKCNRYGIDINTMIKSLSLHHNLIQ